MIEVTAPGHAPGVWAPTLRRARTLRLPGALKGARVLVAAAHADDETLGAGGLMAALGARGARFVVVVATDGAAALPRLSDERRRELAATRERETHDAVRELGLRAETHFLGLPDGRAAGHTGEITDALAALGAGVDLVLAPWRGDPHPDHRAVGEAAAGAGLSSSFIEYPVWMRHGQWPGDVPRERLVVHRLTRGQARRKQRAIRAHHSQITVWDDEHQPVLPPSVIALFQDRLEPYFVEEPW